MTQVQRTLMLDGGLPDYLVTSSGRRFARVYTVDDGSYAEYFLETPDELHAFTTGEMITVVRQDAMFVGYYEGFIFGNDSFRAEGENWNGTVRVCR
ncbi:hypothetical protein [Cohnella soli]|uniref:Uncharacterized protein n=1 Tax=Cohnella soli TaxID=425005 RepID=A0ABW0HMP1_9BACL